MFKTMMRALNKPNHNSPSLEDIQKISPYIFCRWLSGNQYTIQAANQLNLYYEIPIENQFHIINKAFGGKIKFIKYPKNDKIDNSKDIELLSEYFKINMDLAREYLELISIEELENIRAIYL